MNSDKKILIVEDDLLILDLYKKALSFLGFQMISANNGKDAYELIIEQRPDLVLTDIVMPSYDGFYLLAKIQKNKSLSTIPVWVFSNLDSTDDKKEALGLGASDFLLKTSLTPADLTKKLEEYWDKK